MRGNGARYYIHLRAQAAQRPWQYYQAAFETSADWQEVILPWSDFIAQGGLPEAFAPEDILGLGIVAYGADYDAALDVDWVGTLQ